MSGDCCWGSDGENGRYRGVRKRKWGRWVSEIRQPNSRARIWLGSYDTPEKAARAFDAAMYCLRGRDGASSRFNFPNDLPTFIPAPVPCITEADIQTIATRCALRPPAIMTSDRHSSATPQGGDHAHLIQPGGARYPEITVASEEQESSWEEEFLVESCKAFEAAVSESNSTEAVDFLATAVEVSLQQNELVALAEELVAVGAECGLQMPAVASVPSLLQEDYHQEASLSNMSADVSSSSPEVLFMAGSNGVDMTAADSSIDFDGRLEDFLLPLICDLPLLSPSSSDGEEVGLFPAEAPSSPLWYF